MRIFSRNLLFAAVAVVILVAGNVEALTKYTVTDLGSLGGGGTEAYGINNAGQIVGLSKDSNGFEHAFLYENGSMINLNTLGWSWTMATAINDKGQIVGYDWVRSFLYENGLMTELGTPGYAKGINNNGQIVSFSNPHAFLYENGSVIDLGTLGGPSTIAYGINDNDFRLQST